MMQAILGERFKRRIERLNAPNYSYLKILFGQLAVYFAAFALGVLGFYFADIPFSDAVNSRILLHLTYLFEECDGFFAYVNKAFFCASFDILHLIFVFIFSFTVFATFACVISSFIRGIAFGFSTAYFLLSVTGGVISPNHFGAALASFLLFGVISATVLVVFSSNSVLFSFEFLNRRRNRRNTFGYCIKACSVFGTLMIFSFIRCILCMIFM